MTNFMRIVTAVGIEAGSIDDEHEDEDIADKLDSFLLYEDGECTGFHGSDYHDYVSVVFLLMMMMMMMMMLIMTMALIMLLMLLIMRRSRRG